MPITLSLTSRPMLPAGNQVQIGVHRINPFGQQPSCFGILDVSPSLGDHFDKRRQDQSASEEWINHRQLLRVRCPRDMATHLPLAVRFTVLPLADPACDFA